MRKELIKRATALLTVIQLLIFTETTATAQNTIAEEKRISALNSLPPGLSYKSEYFESFQVHILEVDPNYYIIKPSRAGQGRLEHVLPMARRNNAIAAVNGGFFHYKGVHLGLPIGILKIDHEWHVTPRTSHGAIGWSEYHDTVLFDEVLTEINGYSDGYEFPIDGINVTPTKDLITLHTHFFPPQFLTTQDGLDFIITKDRVSKISYRNTKIPEESSVLSIGKKRIKDFSSLTVGKKVHCNVQVIPQSTPPYTTSEQWEKVPHITSASPILVRNGENVVHLTTTNHPFSSPYKARTAVGLRPDGHWIFVVVDGKLHPQPNAKQGVTLTEMADIMLGCGCIDALNLDSGGSSIMVIKNTIVSTPCGEIRDVTSGENVRCVSDAIMIIPRK